MITYVPSGHKNNIDDDFMPRVSVQIFYNYQKILFSARQTKKFATFHVMTLLSDKTDQEAKGINHNLLNFYFVLPQKLRNLFSKNIENV